MGFGSGSAKTRSRSPPRQRGVGGLASGLGNVSVSMCPTAGVPAVQMTHPCGDSCTMRVAGAAVTSWKNKSGLELLTAGRGSDAGLVPCGLPPGTTAESWSVEALSGGGGASTAGEEESETKVIVSSEVMCGAVRAISRVTITILPESLTAELDIANDMEEDVADASLQLGAIGFRFTCAGPAIAATSETMNVEGALHAFGMKLSMQGFSTSALVGVSQQACCVDVASAGGLLLGPGQVVSGTVVLEQQAS
mmetsp:Transcript_43197/g.99591  ORF Transcript_43197/g.99591 Transcript_43197/m.99591 type:complete len:251 (-) Transcript_43197:8-760(-)